MISKIRHAAGSAFKSLGEMIHGGQSNSSWQNFFNFLPSSKRNYAREVGDGIDTGVLMSPITYVSRNLPQARLAVKSEKGLDHSHPLVKLLEDPNAFYDGNALMAGTLISWFLGGDAYYIKVRPGKAESGAPAALWYVPHWLIEPKWEGNDFISYYEYRPSSAPPIKFPVDRVVHIRNGINPRDVRRGLSPFAAQMREAFIDNEASNFVASLLLNGGVPGLMITPGDDTTLSTDQRNELKAYAHLKTTGDHRGEPLVFSAPMKLEEFGFDPGKMDVSGLRNVSEERVCSAIGLPAAVVGFGTGLEKASVGATIKELRGMAWTDCIMPTGNSITAGLTKQLGPDFGLKEGESLVYDYSDVRALAPDRVKQADAHTKLVAGGIERVSEARRDLGLEVGPQDEKYLIPLNLIEVPSPEPKATGKGLNSSELKRKRRLSKIQKAILAVMDRQRAAFEKALIPKLIAFFEILGQAAERAYLATGSKSLSDYYGEEKADDDELHIEAMFSRAFMNIDRFESDFGGIIGAHHVRVFSETLGAIEAATGIATDIPDAVELEILGHGADRSRLVDLTKKTKNRVLNIIRDAREEGLGPPAIARRIRDAVPAGRFKKVSTRALLIARTETREAQNFSAIRMYRGMEGATGVQIVDNRTGHGDADCSFWSGRVVSFDQGQQLLFDEHPNGTRDLVPYFGDLPEDGNA